MSVPRTTQVVPGALVNIVLKADQGTGRQVRGTVRDVLTRGDHHRGIKVRLADGRIGRVQSIAAAGDGAPPSGQFAPEAAPADDSSPLEVVSEPGSGPSRPYGRRMRFRDMRLDEPLERAPEQIDLAAYIVPSKRKGKGKKGVVSDSADASGVGASNGEDASGTSSAATDVKTATVTCPVCGTFEGDEAAVNHHVETHFD